MSKGRELRSFDYVNHPYEQVRDVLKTNALDVFSGATTAAATRARSVATKLHVEVAGIEIGTEIEISLKGFDERTSEGRAVPVTHMQIEWKAAKSPHLFPFMTADLAVYPLTQKETQLELSGKYEPPMGALGSALDAIAGHRIAEASVHRFVTDVADFLRNELHDDDEA